MACKKCGAEEGVCEGCGCCGDCGCECGKDPGDKPIPEAGKETPSEEQILPKE